MCMIRALYLCLALAHLGLVAVETKQDIGFNSFKELGQALDEQMNILNDYIDQAAQTSQGAIQGLMGSGYSTFDVKDVDNRVQITLQVPGVEDSDQIKAYVNIQRKTLKVVIPQKDSITKVVIKNLDGHSSSIKYVSQQRSEQRQEGKNRQSFHMSSSKKVSYKTLPFAVDLNERSVEYKENDQLIITLNKLKPAPVKKAQPKVIPVKSK
jgi:HSP20 family molecular chaperone IbpA